MSSPLPIDVGDLDTPMPDLGHEAIRQVVLSALAQVWSQHQALVDQITALQARVAALEPHTTAGGITLGGNGP